MMGAPASSLSQEAKAVVEAIENLKKQYSLDTNRFIICGFSIGGSGAYHLIQFMPDYWAAAVPCSAGGDSTKIELIAKTPIWHHHGSNDNNGGALKRMSTALENHRYPVLRITSTQVVNSQAAYKNEIQKGTKPKDIIFKNSNPSYDSVSRAIESGARYLFLMFNGGDHESARLNANHNPLLATWAFSKVKNETTPVLPTIISSKTSYGMKRQFSSVLTLNRSDPAMFSNGRIYSLLGQTDHAKDVRRNYGVQILRTEN